jgi:four helix bundle protein
MEESSKKVYDLEERTFLFAKRVRDFCLKVLKNSINNEYIKQLVRAGSSPGANYIEANESLGDNDFKMKIRTCRREAKEAIYWLKLILTDETAIQENERNYLIKEATELVAIFSAILNKRNKN